MNFIYVVDDGAHPSPLLYVRDDVAADNIVRALVENGMMVKRTHVHPGGMME